MYERMAVVLEAVARFPRSLPVVTQVVLHEVLYLQMLFEIKHLRIVVGAHLHGRLSNFLLLGRNLRAFVNQQSLFVGVEQDLARKGQASEPGSDNDYVVVISSLHTYCVPPRLSAVS